MPDDKVDILIVDDLADKVLVYETILDELGENLVVARSGAEALAQVLPPRVCRHSARRVHAGNGRPGDRRPDPAAETIRSHADHLRHRLRRRGSGRTRVRSRGRGLYPRPSHSGGFAGQGQSVRRPVPHDATGQATGRRAHDTRRRAVPACGGRRSKSAAGAASASRAPSWASRSTSIRRRRTPPGCRSRFWPRKQPWSSPHPSERRAPSSHASWTTISSRKRPMICRRIW